MFITPKGYLDCSGGRSTVCNPIASRYLGSTGRRPRGLDLGVPGRHRGALPSSSGHELRQLHPAALRSWAIPTLGELALKPWLSPAIFVAALILREIWPADSPNTLVPVSTTASWGRMASRAPHGGRSQVEHRALRRLVGLRPHHVQPARAVRVNLDVPSPECRGLRAAEQAIPHHLQEGQVVQGTPRGLRLCLLAPAFALVDPLDPCRRLHRGKRITVQTLGLPLWLPVLPGQSFHGGLHQRPRRQSGCPPKWWAAAIAARRKRTVASVLPSVSTRCSR